MSPLLIIVDESLPLHGTRWPLYDITCVPLCGKGTPDGSAAQKFPRDLDHGLGRSLEETVALVGKINEARFR